MDKHPGGRPTKYSKQMLRKVQTLFDNYEAFDEIPITVTTSSGTTTEKMQRVPNPPILKRNIAKHLGIAWSTLCLWEKEHKEFSDLLNQRTEINEDIITENGLNGLYQGNFATHYTKAKLGWRDKSTEQINDEAEAMASLLDRLRGS